MGTRVIIEAVDIRELVLLGVVVSVQSFEFAALLNVPKQRGLSTRGEVLGEIRGLIGGSSMEPNSSRQDDSRDGDDLSQQPKLLELQGIRRSAGDKAEGAKDSLGFPQVRIHLQAPYPAELHRDLNTSFPWK